MVSVNKLKNTFSLLFLLSLFVVLSLVSGCEALKTGLAMLDKPTARVTDARLSEMTIRDATIEIDVEISNPYNVGLPLGNMEYALSGEGTEFLSGNVDSSKSIPSEGKKIVKLPVRITFDKLMNTLSSVKPGEVISYQADLSLFMEAPGNRTIELPLSYRDEFPVPTVPEFEVETIALNQIGLTKTTGQLTFKIKNTHQFPVTLNNMDYDLKLGGADVIESDITSAVQFGSSEVKLIKVPVSISGSNLGSGLMNILRSQTATYGLNGEVTLDTRYGQFTVPYDSSGETRFRSD